MVSPMDDIETTPDDFNEDIDDEDLGALEDEVGMDDLDDVIDDEVGGGEDEYDG